MDKVVIGIDQSYTRTGITVLCNKEVFEMYSLDFKGCKEEWLKEHGQARERKQKVVEKWENENLLPFS